MPKMVRMEVNPDFKPQSDADKQAYAAIKKKGAPRNPVPYVTALENIRHSGAMLRIVVDEPSPAVRVLMHLEDMPTEQLKLMMLTAGATPTKKALTREEIIQVIRTKMDALDVIEDDGGE